MSDELHLWKYTAGKDAEPWVSDYAYVRTVESLLPVVERALKLTIDAPATAIEIEAGIAPLKVGPGFVPRHKRAHYGEKDAEYLRLKALEAAAVDDVEASDLRKAMDARADALIAEAAEREARG